MSDSAGDRRPISARGWAASQSATRLLVRRGVSANTISVIGALAGLVGGACFAATNRAPVYAPWLWLLGAVMVEVRLLANMFDGMVAIESGTASRYGELYNDVPDRVSDTAFLVGAGYAAGSEPWLGWAAAVAAMGTAYIRALGRGLTGTQDFCGPMAKPHRMHLLALAAVIAAICLWLESSRNAGVTIQAALYVILVGALWTSIRRLLRLARRLREESP